MRGPDGRHCDAARRLGWGVDEVRDVLGAMPDASSLNRLLGNDGDASASFLRTRRPPTRRARCPAKWGFSG